MVSKMVLDLAWPRTRYIGSRNTWNRSEEGWGASPGLSVQKFAVGTESGIMKKAGGGGAGVGAGGGAG